MSFNYVCERYICNPAGVTAIRAEGTAVMYVPLLCGGTTLQGRSSCGRICRLYLRSEKAEPCGANPAGAGSAEMA